MNFIKQIERMQLLVKLVKSRRTGSPDDLADRLGISRRQLYVYLDYLKDYGLEICFSRTENSFVYCDEKEIVIDLNIKVLDVREMHSIVGGKKQKIFFPCYFSARSRHILVA
ncbi:HTH domain-containing protein [Litoribacter populi]|uniref:HTH domain-containing protein n=1 Tax=Litoribacter populi TaxID=2598460 RepID=UPI00117F03A3|nr:HTH domain-containing protein [Litoribacter populi]